MRVRYVSVASADCTSDPHRVHYEDDPELIATMLNDIVRVCENDMVQAVRSVEGTLGKVDYESDYYRVASRSGDVAASGMFPEKHKVNGLVFYSDAPDRVKHLPPGLTGVREFVKVALKHPEQLKYLSIGVVWHFAGDASCSDYIGYHRDRPTVVNYGSQDWWTESEKYGSWCQEMANFLNREFPSNEGTYEPN